MSSSDALINLAIWCVTVAPFMVLAWWVLRKTPVQGLTGVKKWRAYRIRVGAGGMILLGVGLLLYFAFSLLMSL
ncbi:MAG: hypothetical protein RLP44_25285 [Aggregatilineales bacterium]